MDTARGLDCARFWYVAVFWRQLRFTAAPPIQNLVRTLLLVLAGDLV